MPCRLKVPWVCSCCACWGEGWGRACLRGQYDDRQGQRPCGMSYCRCTQDMWFKSSQHWAWSQASRGLICSYSGSQAKENVQSEAGSSSRLRLRLPLLLLLRLLLPLLLLLLLIVLLLLLLLLFLPPLLLLLLPLWTWIYWMMPGWRNFLRTALWRILSIGAHSILR